MDGKVAEKKTWSNCKWSAGWGSSVQAWQHFLLVFSHLDTLSFPRSDSMSRIFHARCSCCSLPVAWLSDTVAYICICILYRDRFSFSWFQFSICVHLHGFWSMRAYDSSALFPYDHPLHSLTLCRFPIPFKQLTQSAPFHFGFVLDYHHWAPFTHSALYSVCLHFLPIFPSHISPPSLSFAFIHHFSFVLTFAFAFVFVHLIH